MALRSVSTIVCSEYFTVCINNDQNVVSFGKSKSGAHGHEEEYNVFPPKIISSLNHIISISVGWDHCACLDNDGNIFTFGSNKYGHWSSRLRKPARLPWRSNGSPCGHHA